VTRTGVDTVALRDSAASVRSMASVVRAELHGLRSVLSAAGHATAGSATSPVLAVNAGATDRAIGELVSALDAYAAAVSAAATRYETAERKAARGSPMTKRAHRAASPGRPFAVTNGRRRAQ
jgi:uncharacterized protein YukE